MDGNELLQEWLDGMERAMAYTKANDAITLETLCVLVTVS